MIHSAIYLFLLLIMLPVASAQPYSSKGFEGRALIRGTIPYADQMVYCTGFAIDDFVADISDSAKTDRDGNFVLSPLCTSEKVYSLYLSNKKHIMSNIFLAINDTLIIRQASVDSTTEIISDKGRGTSFLKHFYKTYPVPQDFFTKVKEKKWKDCFTILDALTRRRAAALMMNTSLLNKYPALKRELDDIVRFSACSDKLNLLMYLYYDDKDSVEIHDKHCLNFINEIPLYSDKRELTLAYRNSINRYLEFPFKLWRLEKKRKQKLSPEEKMSLRFEFCKMRLEGSSRDYGMFYCFHSLFNFYSDSLAFVVADKQLKEFKTFVTDNRYFVLCENLLTTKRNLAKKQKSPEFSLPDLNNKTVSLSDFRGKTIYMEFTGTWCGPCKKEIPYMKELQKKFKDNQNVQFIAIWLEGENFSAWTDYVNKTGIGGVHLYSTSQMNGKVAKDYMISGVPRFFIIDKEGKIVNSHAKRPSEDVFDDIINAIDEN